MLKRRIIEAVADRLSAALVHLAEAAEKEKNVTAGQDNSECKKPSNLPPCLKVGFFVLLLLIPQLPLSVNY